MAQPALDFFKKRNLLIKAQPTIDVDPVPVGATDGFRLFDGKTSTGYDTIELPVDQSFLGADDFAIANKRGLIEGDFEIYPPATPGQVATGDAFCERVLLPGAWGKTKDALAKTTTYKPIDTAIPFVAFRSNHTGLLLNALNSRCAISNISAEIGKTFRGHTQIQGDYDNFIKQAFPAVTLPPVDSLILTEKNTVCTVTTEIDGAIPGGAGTPTVDLHVWAKMLTLDTGMGLKKEAYTEHAENNFDGRKGAFTWRIAKTDIDVDFNPTFVRDNGIVIEIKFWVHRVNTLDGLYTLMTVRGKIETVEEVDIDGKFGWDIKGRCLGTEANAGADQYSLEFGDLTP
jgi:hypothetical protein